MSDVETCGSDPMHTGFLCCRTQHAHALSSMSATIFRKRSYARDICPCNQAQGVADRTLKVTSNAIASLKEQSVNKLQSMLSLCILYHSRILSQTVTCPVSKRVRTMSIHLRMSDVEWSASAIIQIKLPAYSAQEMFSTCEVCQQAILCKTWCCNCQSIMANLCRRFSTWLWEVLGERACDQCNKPLMRYMLVVCYSYSNNKPLFLVRGWNDARAGALMSGDR